MYLSAFLGGNPMFKLCFSLAAALYAGFVIWGDPSDFETIETAQSSAPVVSTRDFDAPVILGSVADPDEGTPAVTRSGVTDTVVPNAATIAASTPAPRTQAEPKVIGAPTVVSLVRPAAPAPAAATETTISASSGPLVQVTGTRVNMRAGPSTANPVIESLPGGTLAEKLGETENGWYQIRALDSGEIGYMSGRFLEPA